MFHPPAWWDRGGSPAGIFSNFDSLFGDNQYLGIISVLMIVTTTPIGDALGGKINRKRIHLQVALNEHSALEK